MCFLGYASVAIDLEMEKCCQGTHTCFNCNIWRCPLTAVCGYSSVSCNTHDMPRHQRPTHTVQMLHTIIPPHCITAGRENVQNDANHIKLIVIGVRNITTIESTMALHLFFVMVVRLKIVKKERKVHHEMHLSWLVNY